MMLRILYSSLMCLCLPFIFVRLWIKGQKSPAYRQRIKERLGIYQFDTSKKRIWLHAVSVGEVNAAAALIKRIIQRWPDVDILVTTMTPTGADQLKRQFPQGVEHRYIPYDIPFFIHSAFNSVQPALLIIMETEIWPNLLHGAASKKVPIVYINMRLSERSFSGYLKIRRLIEPQLKKVALFSAQTKADMNRVIELGAPTDRAHVYGNIKYDAVLPDGVQDKGAALREQLGKSRLVWIAASTHLGEDELILKAHSTVLNKYPDALLILVPRHPERFDSVYALAKQSYRVNRRTQSTDKLLDDCQIYLGDTMGELLNLYAASDSCFVGGSLVPHGGQNVLEPWLIGKPVIVGPHTFNFALIIQQAKEDKALVEVKSAQSLAQAVIELHDNTHLKDQLVMNANQLLLRNKGALDSSVEMIASYLN